VIAHTGGVRALPRRSGKSWPLRGRTYPAGVVLFVSRALGFEVTLCRIPSPEPGGSGSSQAT
jgi:hypothetical protein